VTLLDCRAGAGDGIDFRHDWEMDDLKARLRGRFRENDHFSNG
jgi:hypothetical protein